MNIRTPLSLLDKGLQVILHPVIDLFRTPEHVTYYPSYRHYRYHSGVPLRAEHLHRRR